MPMAMTRPKHERIAKINVVISHRSYFIEKLPLETPLQLFRFCTHKF